MDYHFISNELYSMMRDGDQFLEYNNFNGNDYGTSRKVVESIVAMGKVPVMEMDYHVGPDCHWIEEIYANSTKGIQQLKDQNYPARFLFVGAPTLEELENRLRKRGTESEDKIQARLKTAKEEILNSEIEGFHDRIIINVDIDRAFQEFEEFVFTEKGEVDVPTASHTEGGVA